MRDGTYQRHSRHQTPKKPCTHVRDAQAAQRPFDLLIADVKTPGSSELRMIENVAQSFQKLKIVTMTAYHSPELAAHVQQLDVHTYLVKPVAPSEFRQARAECTGRKSSDTGPGRSPTAAVQPATGGRRTPVGQPAPGNQLDRSAARARQWRDTGNGLPGRRSGRRHALGVALMDAQHSIAQALAQTMQTAKPHPPELLWHRRTTASAFTAWTRHTQSRRSLVPRSAKARCGTRCAKRSRRCKTRSKQKSQNRPPPRSSARSDGFDMVERILPSSRRRTRAQTQRARTPAQAPQPQPYRATLSLNTLTLRTSRAHRSARPSSQQTPENARP